MTMCDYSPNNARRKAWIINVYLQERPVFLFQTKSANDIARSGCHLRGSTRIPKARSTTKFAQSRKFAKHCLLRLAEYE
jgi:hypothetical protein